MTERTTQLIQAVSNAFETVLGYASQTHHPSAGACKPYW